MYKPFKAIITRPTGIALLDKFQRDVVEALKSFVLTIYDRVNSGLVPPPKTTGNQQILFDDGWSAATSVPVGAHTHIEADVTNLVTDLASKVPTSRTISTTSPITGGGDLTANRTLGFDTSDLDNNARVGVRINGGTTYKRRRINLLDGANVSLGVSDDAVDEEVDITVNASSSGLTLTELVVTVPSPTYEYNFTITDAGIVGTSKIAIFTGIYKSTDPNIPGNVQLFIKTVGTGSANATLYSVDNTLIVGNYNFYYAVV